MRRDAGLGEPSRCSSRARAARAPRRGPIVSSTATGPGLDERVAAARDAGRRRGSSWSWAHRSRIATRRSQARSVSVLLIGGPLALLLASLAGYGARRRGAAAGRVRCGARRTTISAAEPGRRLPVPPARRRARPARRDAERDARPARARRSRASGASSPTRATSCARRCRCCETELELALRAARTAGGARGALRSAAEETRPALAARRGPARARPRRRGRAAAAAGAARRRGAARARARAASQRAAGGPRGSSVEAPTASTLHADRLRTEQALGNLVENALRHGEGAVVLAAEPAERRRSSCTCCDRGPGFRPVVRRPRLRALHARRTAPARAAGPGSASRSST